MVGLKGVEERPSSHTQFHQASLAILEGSPLGSMKIPAYEMARRHSDRVRESRRSQIG